MKKYYFTLCIAICISLILSSISVFAYTKEEKFTIDQYNMLSYEYQKQTGLTASESEKNFEEINLQGLTQDDSSYVEGLISGADSFSRVLYIQDNYNELISKLDQREKKILDKYFLYQSLLLYKDDPVKNFDIEKIVQNSSSSTNSINSIKATTNVAQLQVFSDGTTNVITGSSGLSLDMGIHAFITVKNISSSDIVVGKMTVAPGETMSLGTWGNKGEHTGLWYNLEAKFISDDADYANRVSLKMKLTSSNLRSLNSFITANGDQWSKTWNCSTFAVNCWNIFNLATSKELSAGVINTPKNLANSIKSKSGYTSKSAVPCDYAVYYAQGRSTPKRSSVY